MSQSEPKILVEDRGAVSVLTMNRPDKINAMDGDLYEQLDAALQRIAADDAIRAVVITGAGGNFSAGGDLKWLQEMHERYDEPGRPWNYHFGAYDSLQNLEKPVISAIEGYCVASAFNLAVLYTDIRVAGEGAQFGIPGPRRGQGVGPYPMPWDDFIGIGHIKYLALTGLHVPASDALRMGIVNEVVPQGTAVERAVALAEITAQGNPHEIAGFKEFWREYPKVPGASYMTVADSIRKRIDLQRTDLHEGRKAFLDKRTPTWGDK